MSDAKETVKDQFREAAEFKTRTFTDVSPSLERQLADCRAELARLKALACWQEDDNEKPTDEWLPSVGFEAMRGDHWERPDTGFFLTHSSRGHLIACSGDCDLCIIETRGQLRRLLSALTQAI